MDFLLPGKPTNVLFKRFTDRWSMVISAYLSTVFEEMAQQLGRELLDPYLDRPQKHRCKHGNELKMWKVAQFSHHAHCSSTSRSGRSWVLQKRYNDFSHLHEELKKSKCLWLNKWLRWPWGWSGLYASRVSQGVGEDTRTSWNGESSFQNDLSSWFPTGLGNEKTCFTWFSPRTNEQHIAIGNST